MAHVEGAAGREEGLEENEPVLVPHVTIAPPGGARGDEVEGRKRRRARKSTVVETDDADDLGREHLPRAEARDRHRIVEPHRFGGRCIGKLEEHIVHHVAPDRRFGPPGLSLEGANETADLVHLLRKPGPGRRRRVAPGEEAADHLVERPDPIAGARSPSSRVRMANTSSHQVMKRPRRSASSAPGSNPPARGGHGTTPLKSSFGSGSA